MCIIKTTLGITLGRHSLRNRFKPDKQLGDELSFFSMRILRLVFAIYVDIATQKRPLLRWIIDGKKW